MKSIIFASLFVSALYSQQAVAGSWNDAQSFTSPENCNNTCTSQRSGGYNFGNVPDGQFPGLDGLTFSGFNCESSFHARKGRRGLTRRTQFSGKAVVAKATTDNNCPKFSAGQNNAFSLTEMHVSVDKDSDLTFEYGMPDGSTCKQVSRCSADGTVVKNNQCGGAKHVNIKGDCTFGIHSMIFDCSPPPPPKTVSTTTISQSSTTTTSIVCKSTETLTGGTCVPTPPPSTTTTAVKTTTTGCAETEVFTEGKCVPKTTTTTPSITTTTAPVTTTPATTPSTTPATTPSTTPSTTPLTTPSTTPVTTPATTPSKTPSTTPATTPSTTAVTTPICASTETLTGGKCAPLTTTVLPTTVCKSTETLSGGTCTPITTLTSSLVTTEIVVTTLTTCPVTSTSGTITIITSTVSTTVITSTATFCPVCGESPPTTIASTTVNAPPPLTTTTPAPAPPPPTTTPAAPSCKDTEIFQNGSCVPKPPTTTPASTTTCKDVETLSNGSCMPKTTISTTPVTTPSAPPPSTTICKDTETTIQGSCKPKPPPTTTSTPAPPPVPSCKDKETVSNGVCVSKPVTGGITTTVKNSVTTVNPAPPQTPIPEAPCPSLLPRCLATWMSKAGSCASNSDISCFCPSPDFISSVQECITAWGGSTAEVQSAMSFLVGICAEFVPKNPGICTGVPSTITLIPNPSTSTVTVTQQGPKPTGPPPMPFTVITFTQTITKGSTTTVTQTAVTVPQVVFSTVSKEVTVAGGPTQTSGVGLVPFVQTTTAVVGATGAPLAPQTSSGSFGRPDATTAKPNSPIQTFTGAAPVNACSAVAVGLAMFAFLI